MKQPSHTSIAERPNKPQRMFINTFCLLLLLANLCGYLIAASDKSWGAMYILIVAMPVYNGTFLLGGNIAVLLMKLRNKKLDFSSAWMVVWGAPFLAAAVSVALILMLDIHGC